jgi:APA family basic amino acid/polyamine antiporter
MVSSADTGSRSVLAQESNQELVKSLGLTSATTLVMGSMIGSGIFIVSAEIAREVNSPFYSGLGW